MAKRYLTTFSGKYGDILWALPTVRKISREVKKPVDFGIMPAYAALLPLLQYQPYIAQAFVMEDWKCCGSPFGDQPWKAPEPEEYEKVWHLTYKCHPNGMSLMEFIATQQAMTFKKSPIPFITVFHSDSEGKPLRFIAYAFNDMYVKEKTKFLGELQAGLECAFVDVSKKDWADAARIIQMSSGFLGCRSANYVLAAGLGKRMVTFEPHPSRKKSGHLGVVFGNPFIEEHAMEAYNDVPKAVQLLRTWLDEEPVRSDVDEFVTPNAR